MDQESFRRLLETPNAGSSTSSTSRGSLFKLGFKNAEKARTIDASQPAFKPRKVKKSSDSQYRDRAAERRVGEGNDYAQVEAVLEDFEKRNIDNEDKNAVEQQRRYLGGDGDHSILVKGLDVALLEQNKARAALSTEDDDSLEQAFQEVTSEPIVPKKRTREDLIRELKEKRAQKGEGVEETKVVKTAEEEALLLEEAKKKGKFKPIGFKPIGAPDEATKKKKKVKGDGKDVERKKKRRKVDEATTKELTSTDKTAGQTPPPTVPPPASIKPPSQKPSALEPEPEPTPDDFDIFAGAGEYEGLDLGDDNDDDDDDDDGQAKPPIQTHPELEEGEELASGPRRWIETDEPLPLPVKPEILPTLQRQPSPRQSGNEEEDEEGEIEQPTRLVPLASSALPSIKDFLAMDGASGSKGNRRKRGGKKKGANEDDEDSKKRNAEAKADRDYKKLKSYTDKKAGASK